MNTLAVREGSPTGSEVRRMELPLAPEVAWWGVVAVFLVHGLVVSTWVSRIAAIKNSLHIGDGALGTALLGSAIGSLIAIPVAGWAVSRYGVRRTVQTTAIGFAASLLPLAMAPNLPLLAAALIIYGAFAGANDVAINAEAVSVDKRLSGPTMSRFHAMFSIGGIAGSGAGAAIASAGITPRVHFGMAALAIIAGVAAISSVLADYREPVRRSAHISWKVPPAPLLILSAIGFCIFLSEGAIADWTSVFLSESLHAGNAVTAAGYGVFSASMTVFRLSGDYVTRHLGRRRTIRTGALLAAGGLVLVVTATGPMPALIGFGAVGAGFSSIIPLVFAAASRVSAVSEAAGVATVSGIGYLGFLVGPPTIGFVSELISLRAGLFVLVVLSTTAAILVGELQRRSGPGQDPLA